MYGSRSAIHTILKPHDRVALVFLERIIMTDKAVFNVGDVVVEVPAYVGQKVSGQKFTIIATYRNANGPWHVAETTDSNGLTVQVPLNDGGPYLHRIQEATKKPQNGPRKPVAGNPFLRDLEAMRGDWDHILGPVARWFVDEARKSRD